MATPNATPQRQARSQQSPKQQGPAQACFDRRQTLARLEDLVRADPRPEVVQQALQAMLQTGELAFADLPAVEQLLAGLVGQGAEPKKAAGPKPKKFHELPQAEQDRWEALLLRDATVLKEKAREWYVSESDEAEICALVERWVAEDEKNGFGGTLMDRFILRAADKTFTKGLFDVTTTTSDELKRRMSDKGKARLIAALKKGKALGRFADEKPPELPGFWKDVVAKTVVGLPGGITSFTGGALQSLPLPYMEEAGDWLNDQSRQYLEAVGFDDAQAGAIADSEQMVGNIWGQGMQMLSGLGALGKAAKAGELAQWGLKGAKAAEYAEFALTIKQAAEDLNAFYVQHKRAINTIVKIMTDVMAKQATGKDITPELVAEAAFSRVSKELLSIVGERGFDGSIKKKEDAAFDEGWKGRREGRDLEQRAARDEKTAGKLRQKSSDMKGQVGSAGPANLAGWMEKEAAADRVEATDLKMVGRDKLGRYLLRNMARRSLVSVIHALAKEFVKSLAAKDGSGAAAVEDMKSRWMDIAQEIGVTVTREVVTDLINNVLMRGLGLAKGAPQIVQESIKLSIDGLTKVGAEGLKAALR
jgi:hypothetical protein